MNISSVMRLESRTSSKNFQNKSMSFYIDIDQMSWLMGCKEVLLVHTDYETEQSRTMVINGQKLFSSLEVKSFRKKPVLVYRY